MESTSSVNVHHRQPDGTLLLIKKYERGKPKRALLVLPDLGESIIEKFYDRLARFLLEQDMAIYVVELRGHTLSEGKWSLESYQADIAYLIAFFKQRFEDLYALGVGLSASMLLEYDDQGHTMRGVLPPLPHGLVLLSPVFEGTEMLPRVRGFLPVATAFKTKEGFGFGHCKLEKRKIKRFWESLATYKMAPVRIQTPTQLLVPMHEHADPLKRVFGSVSIRRVNWLHHFRAGRTTSAEQAYHLQDIKDAFDRVLSSEKPIRFSAIK